MCADLVGGAHERGDVVGARRLADQHEAGQHGEASRPGHGQGHARALPRVGAVLPVADQEERGEARDLPEHGQQQQVVGEHDSEHGRREEREPRVESSRWIARAQVVAGVEDDEEPDAEDQAAEEQAEAVQPQRDGEAHAGDPRPGRARRVAREHRGSQGEHRGQRGAGHRGEPPRGAAPRTRADGRGDGRARDERETDHQQQRDLGPDHGCAGMSARGPAPSRRESRCSARRAAIGTAAALYSAEPRDGAFVRRSRTAVRLQRGDGGTTLDRAQRAREACGGEGLQGRRSRELEFRGRAGERHHPEEDQRADEVQGVHRARLA